MPHTHLPFTLEHGEQRLIAQFPEPQAMLSWSLTHPGAVQAQSVVWLQVRNADLGLDFDPVAYAHAQLAACGAPQPIALMTSRTLRHHHSASHRSEGINAHCLITLGLSNAERVGQRREAEPAVAGTINLLCHVETPLSRAAQLESLSVATQARTAALLALAYRPEDGSAPITGTGTDCIVISSPLGEPGAAYAGTHTAIGEAVGASVYKATLRAAAQWLAQHPPTAGQG